MPSADHDRSARARGFWTGSALFCLFLLAAGAPSPLYGLYAERWHFSTIMLTVVFGVYALSLLVALVVFGDLSDAVGRRPVLFAASAILVAALGLFIAADGVAWMILARLLQGFATGLLTAAASASMLDLAPERRPGFAALVSVVTAMGGQATGALASGALVQYAPQPTRLVFAALIVTVLVLVALAYRVVPETVAPRRRFVARVRVGVAPPVRSAFLAATPCLVATWALSSLYLSLGSSIVMSLDGSANRLVGVTALALLLGTATVSAIVARARGARTRMLGGCAVLAAGAVLTVFALATRDATVFYLSTFVAGLGFGTAFSGALQTLTGLAGPDDRAALVAAIYVVAYLSFSVPAVIVGVVSTFAGLIPTATIFSAAVAVLAFTAFVATRRATSTGETPCTAPPTSSMGSPSPTSGTA